MERGRSNAIQRNAMQLNATQHTRKNGLVAKVGRTDGRTQGESGHMPRMSAWAQGWRATDERASRNLQ